MDLQNLLGKKDKKKKRDLGDVLGGADEAADAEFEDVEPETAEAVVEQGEAVAEDMTAKLPAIKAKEKALAPFTDGLPFDPDRIARRIHECGVSILEHMIDVGKYLIWSKEEMGHGDFLEWLESTVNMSRQRASEFMRVAHRVVNSGAPSTRTFLLQTAGDNKKKLLALLDVSDEEIEEAMETESFLGRPLEEVETMSYRQMQSELKREKKRREESDLEAADLKHQVRELKQSLKDATTTKDPTTPEQDAFEPWELQHTRVLEALSVLEQAFYEIEKEEGEEGLVTRAGAIQNAIRTLNQKLTAVAQAGVVELKD